MELISLTCSHCGAPLEVPEKTRYLTCSFCSARLEVRESGGAVYTEELQKIGERTEQLAEDLETFKLQNELERLDREWQTSKHEYMLQGKDGEYQVPSKMSSMLGGMIAVAIGLIWIAYVVLTDVALFAPVGVVVMAIGFTMAGRGVKAAEEYKRHLNAYEEKRGRLLDKIRETSG